MRPGTPQFVGSRLREAREARALSVREIADAIGVSPQAISQYEHQHQTPSPETMRRLARALKLPTHFFLQQRQPIDRGLTFYRSLASTAKSERSRADRLFGWLLDVVGYLRQFIHFPDVEFPDFEMPRNPAEISQRQIEKAATDVRRFWKLGDGPISNVAWLLENQGAVVTRQRLNSETMDAFSEWQDKCPYIVIGTDKGSAVRSRFDLGHELGHLVLHSRVTEELFNQKSTHALMEKQANLFASAFLMPDKEFSADLYSLSLDGLLALKEKWRVSVAAMIMRIEQLGLASEDQTRRLHINRTRRGWRTSEPLDNELEPEEPQFLVQSFDLVFENNLTRPEIMEIQLGISREDIEAVSGLPTGYFDEGPEPPRLRLFC